MLKQTLLLLGTITICSCCFGQKSDQERYIDKYKDIAIREMQRAKIPASIKLAQALLESSFGQSELAVRANNHFGIKCGGDWKGREYYKKDDDYNDRGQLIKSCFRVYSDPEASFVAHSEFLRNPKKDFRYGFLFDLRITDYKGWAKGLKKAGYATSRTYSQKLIDIIERYKLYQYDRMDRVPPAIEKPDIIAGLDFLVVNEVRYVESESNESVGNIAKRTDSTLRDLIRFNEHINSGKQTLDRGTRVFLDAKKISYKGNNKYHIVTEGETMFSISQLYGLRLDRLLRRNRMSAAMEPALGARIKLRGWKASDPPQLRETSPIGPPSPVLIDEEEADDEFDLEIEPDEGVDADDTKPPYIPLPKLPTPEPDEEEIDDPNDDANLLDPIIPREPPIFQPPKPKTDPIKEDPFEEEPVKKEDPPKDAGVYHEVVKGDTLWNISQRYGTTVDAIVQLNNLPSKVIRRGMRLRVK